MSDQLNEQKRLGEILRLARMELNEEYMKNYNSAHTAWLVSSRSAWQTNGTLLPFSVQFKYPSEEEVVARGVEIYKTLTGAKSPTPKEESSSTTEVVAYTTETAITNVPEPVIDAEVKDVKADETTDVIEDKFKSLITKWGGKGNY